MIQNSTHLPEHASPQRVGHDIVGLGPDDVGNVVRDELAFDRVVRVARDVVKVFEHERTGQGQVLVRIDTSLQRPGADLKRGFQY